MPKSMPKKLRFTDLAISRIGPGIYWDALLPAFGIRVSHKSKTWIVNVRSSKRRFGRFPALGVAEARAKARELFSDRVQPPFAGRFYDLALDFLDHGRTKRGRPLRPATLKEYRRALLIYAMPLHRENVRGISRAQVSNVIREVARERGAPSAMRCRAALSRFWSWCMATGKLDVNVVLGTEGYAVGRRTRVLTDGELAALWGATSEPTHFHMIVRFCLWTGCRRSEAGGMRWSELVDGEWRIPAERSKNHRPLTVPLARQTRAALAAWPRAFGRATLFGHSERGFQDWSKAKKRLDERLKFHNPFALHDLRRTAQTRLIGLGVNGDLVNRILNHAMTPIDETYDLHDYFIEKRAALQKWADKLDEIALKNAQVVKMRRS